MQQRRYSEKDLNQRATGTKIRKIIRKTEENERPNKLSTKKETESKEKERAKQDLE